MKEKYDRAWSLMPESALEKASNVLFVPVFSPDGSFASKVERFEGDAKRWSFMRFDSRTGDSRELFDHDALARSLKEICGGEPCAGALALALEQVSASGCRFEYGGKHFSLQDGELSEYKYTNYCVSPDGKTAVFTREHDLWLLDLETQEESRLTYDGEKHFDYASRPEGDTSFIADKLAGRQSPPGIIWSPDGKYFVTYKLDQRRVRELHLVQSVPDGPDIRPQLHTYKYSMPGDAAVPESTFYICELKTRAVYPVQMPPTSSSTMPPICNITSLVSWSDKGRTLVGYRMSRDFKTVSVYRISPADGGASKLFDEDADTFHFFDFFFLMQAENAECPTKTLAPMWYLDDRRELIWLSQRDGRYQLYGYGESGEARRITRGDFDVCAVHNIDAASDRLLLSVIGLQADPYDHALVSVPLSGGEAEVLTKGDGNHLVTVPPSGEYFVDVLTECDAPPVARLFSADGREIAELARCDASRLDAAGLIKPKRFCVKAADGETDIYGILLLPEANGEKLPLVDYYYGGNQHINVPHTFFSLLNTGFIESIASLGCAVMVVDGMGTPHRGKRFHDACYKNVGSCAGLDDHVAAIKQLCERYPIDIGRVGVWGHSGGGFAALHCMTKYPEVYRCGISSGGNHAQEIYISDWSERFMSAFDSELWNAQRAENLAHKLEGELLLIHGELDDNVHPAHTMRAVDALIKADKDFELLIMPNMHHALRPSKYFRRRILDFFARYLC